PFIIRFKKVFAGMDIYKEDERFTSSMAQQAMIDGGLKKKDRRNKAIVDKISASLILQSWLEQNKI
ncbi:MAG: Holliday junction resolvase RuvX, partial [Bacteroidales bacterium]|nr:Holliday junction resolvase RuvX [Bacteroidales bacterium]